MKILNAIVVLILFSGIAFGQKKTTKATVLWGDEQKESKKSTLSDIVGYNDDGFYTLKTKGSYFGGSTITLEHYNNKVKRTKEVELILKEGKKDKNFEFIVQLNDELYLFTSFLNKKLQKNYLFFQSINKKTLQLNNDLEKIAEISYTRKWNSDYGNYDYSLSRDSSKLIVYYNLPFEEDEPEKFGFHVFDMNMEEIWSRNIELPYSDELFRIISHRLDNYGNVHVLGKKYEKKAKDTRKGEVNYKHHILSYYDNQSNMKEYIVDVPGKYLNEMQIEVDDDRELICAGFYSNVSSNGVDGTFFLKIDSQSKKLIVKNFKEFDQDFLTQNLTVKEEKKAAKKAAKGKDTEMFNYDLDKIILKDDGGVTLIGEQYFVRVKTTTSTNASGHTTTKTRYYYYYNDIIVVDIDSKGDILWAEKIAKRQRTIDDNGFFSSYVLSISNNKLYFVFNDHPENLYGNKSGKYETFRGGKDALIVLVEMDDRGKQTREALFTVKDADIITRPVVCEQISPNELILYGQRKKTHRFAKVTFKN